MKLLGFDKIGGLPDFEGAIFQKGVVILERGWTKISTHEALKCISIRYISPFQHTTILLSYQRRIGNPDIRSLSRRSIKTFIHLKYLTFSSDCLLNPFDANISTFRFGVILQSSSQNRRLKNF